MRSLLLVAAATATSRRWIPVHALGHPLAAQIVRDGSGQPIFGSALHLQSEVECPQLVRSACAPRLVRSSKGCSFLTAYSAKGCPRRAHGSRIFSVGGAARSAASTTLSDALGGFRALLFVLHARRLLSGASGSFLMGCENNDDGSDEQADTQEEECAHR